MRLVFSLSMCRVLTLFLFLTTLVFAFDSAQARNVPGSAAAATGQLTESSSATLINGLYDGLLKVRGDDRGAQSTFGFIYPSTQDPTVTATIRSGSAGFIDENGFGAAVNLGYRKVDNSDLNVDLFTGSVLLLHRPNQDVLLFGGVITDHADGNTLYNMGSLKSRGIGAAAGFDVRLQDSLTLTGSFGYLSLDYDVTRTLGAITGSFDADRFMADLQASSTSTVDDLILTWNLGVRYLQQNNDGYTESGGAVIGSSRFRSLSAVGGTRLRFDRVGVDPFIETDISYSFSNNASLPAGVIAVDSTDLDVRLATGLAHEVGDAVFEAGVGVHISEDGYDGFDGRLRAVFRF